MAVVRVQLKGDGVRKLERAARKLGKNGKTALSRGFIDGARLVRTDVKQAMVAQTSIKKRAIDRTVKGFPSGPLKFIIYGFGPGVEITDVRSVKGGKYSKPQRKALRKHFARFQPRDGRGRFAPWGDSDERAYAEFLRRDLTNKPVTATVWGEHRTFWQSYRGGKGFKSIRASGEHQTLYGPSPGKELVKDQSASAFRRGPLIVEKVVFDKISKASGGVFT